MERLGRTSRAQCAKELASGALGIALLWAFALLGGVAAKAIGVRVPGSVVGMLLMWASLEAGVIRLSLIERGAQFLLAALGLLFVPAGVGFVQLTGAGTMWLKVAAIVAFGSSLSLAISARVAQG